MADKLTARQQKFIEVYKGNGTEAARIAGYTGTDEVLAQTASENLRKPYIAKAIAERQQKEMAPKIATREDRQKFWSDTMNDYSVDMRARLRASELLAKSECDFIPKDDGTKKGVTLEDLIMASQRRIHQEDV